MITERAMLAGVHISIWTALRHDVFQMRQFSLTYRAKVQTLSGQFDVPFPLSWSHCDRLLTVTDNAARDYYEHEALVFSWRLRPGLPTRTSSFSRQLFEDRKELCTEADQGTNSTTAERIGDRT